MSEFSGILCVDEVYQSALALLLGIGLGLGSDFAGSIRGSSHLCGIAGLNPTMGCVPRTGHNPPYGVTAYTKPYSMTGWPSVVVRAGTSPEGLPIGVQVVAHPWREDVALALALHIESRKGGWQSPPLSMRASP